MPKALPSRKPTAAHELVASTARGMCEDAYETMMSNDALRKAWKAQHPDATEKQLIEAFVRKFLVRFLEPARATLTIMLRGPYNDDLKQTIADALILDKSLSRGAPT